MSDKEGRRRVAFADGSPSERAAYAAARIMAAEEWLLDQPFKEYAHRDDHPAAMVSDLLMILDTYRAATDLIGLGRALIDAFMHVADNGGGGMAFVAPGFPPDMSKAERRQLAAKGLREILENIDDPTKTNGLTVSRGGASRPPGGNVH